ncbi:transposase [Bathymodiolus japonicus methanotrophic gill symbiont]|uniref:transposase n=1 Tax=Bathymodiolus japonicus methanotrophic gill symbiont TaxID=113269 RepID=UPI001C8E33CC|nr:transposase [Bathymodiolus japonicus methanotrophic gill symbiont]
MLRDHIEKQNKGNNSSQKHLYVYDKAVTDFVWWDRQKRHANYMISMLKENSIATLVESIPFDSRHEINTGVEAYSVYENKGIKFNVVDYRDPETGKLHRFVTTLPMTINPGTIAMLYFKRWTIEKTFNNTKSNFKETKARGVAIFAKACFGHPSPSKQQKLNATTYASGGPDSSSSPRPDPTRGRNIGSK